MEEVHGVDVSWIHHSHKGKHSAPHVHTSAAATAGEAIAVRIEADIKVDRLHPTRSAPPVPPKDTVVSGSKSDKTTPVASSDASKLITKPPQSTVQDEQRNENPREALKSAHSGTSVPTVPPQGILSPPPSQPSKLPGLLRRNSREKITDSTSPRVNPRRSSASSWISSISSKLGTSSLPNPPSPSQPSSATQNTVPSPVQNSPTTTTQSNKSPEEGKAHVPQRSASFLSNALRRLSSTTQTGRGGLASYNGGVTPRKVLNLDPNRQRCMVPELDSTKLRRVAFCVDVEIAGAPKYNDDKDFKETKKEKASSVKAKDKEEGAALKRPTATLAEADEAAAKVSPTSESKDSKTAESGNASVEKDTEKKKDKKKRTDEEKRERKEQKRRKAEESGSIPMQITRENSAESVPDKPPGSTVPRPLDRPTTDPLRVYRRCCQLRETPILKRITDQLGSTSACVLGTPGVVTVLDLTGSRLTLADMVTLSDWLAIVPVRKLYLEDADINDEGLRVILAGLLAAMTPDFSRKPKCPPNEKYEERSGVVEKIVLKNNQKITKEGWKHISLFIYMCKSLKSIDLSMNAFPTSPINNTQGESANPPKDCVEIFAKSISERLGGSNLEELIMGECSLTAYQIRKITDAVSISGIARLGLAGNNIDAEGLNYVTQYVRSGVCQGLDLGGNDLRDHLDILADVLDASSPVWALSIADCNLDTASLKPLFPSLLRLRNLKFLDLSHNPELFTTKSNVVGLLARYLPALPELRRFHLNHVDMAPWQAISMADIIGECPVLAHLAILGNPQLSALASAKGEEEQEEACALYASLMAAARVSHSIISIEMDVPTADNSEIVRALAKQVVAYCLRNMEAFYPAVNPEHPVSGAAGTIPNKNAPFKEVDIPDVLLHLVGHGAHSGDNLHEGEEDPGPAPDMDYIVGGTGVVKALNYCLDDMRHSTSSMPQSGTSSPRGPSSKKEIVKAKNMSKNLLESARKIRERLQPQLAKESKGEDEWAFRRLLFLDNTLEGIIARFEAEFPETRVSGSAAKPENSNKISSVGLPLPHSSSSTLPDASASQTLASTNGRDSDSDYEDDEFPSRMLRRTSRQLSDVSLAAKALGKEEGTVHKLGQQVKRKILGDEHINVEDGHSTRDSSKPATPGEVDEDLILGGEGEDSSLQERIEDEHIRVLKEKLVMLSGRSSPNLQATDANGHE